MLLSDFANIILISPHLPDIREFLEISFDHIYPETSRKDGCL